MTRVHSVNGDLRWTFNDNRQKMSQTLDRKRASYIWAKMRINRGLEMRTAMALGHQTILQRPNNWTNKWPKDETIYNWAKR
jgi:hypothetical protein